MILVTGGAYCGKTNFIKNKFGVEANDFANISTLSLENGLSSCDINGKYIVISNFEKIIESCLRKDDYSDEIISDFIYNIKNNLEGTVRNDSCSEKSAEVIIEMRQMGAGLVPIDKFQRKLREITGRISCVISENSDEVYNVVCGVGMKIK